MELLKIDDHFYLSDYVSNGSFASLKENVTYKENEDYAILVRITDFVKNWNGNHIYINEKEYNFLGKSKIFPGDLIISNVGQPGMSFVLPDLNKPASLAPNSILVRPKSDRVYNLYFNQYLKTPEVQRQIESICSQTTLKKFNKTSFRNLVLPFPPYADQIRIANVLGKIEEVIQARKNAIDQLDELVKATFYDMFGDPVRNEKGWNKEEIGKHSDSIVPGRDKPKSFTGDIPWITTDKLKNLGFIDKNELNIGLTFDEIQSAKSKIMPRQSILMTCVGDLGLVTIADFECVANQQLHSYQCFSSINNIFTMFCLSYSKSYMFRMASTTTVPYMNKTICNSIPIILPPIELQNQFAAIAQKTEILKATQEKQLLEMEDLYASVSHSAFLGTLDLSRISFDESLLPITETEIEPVVIDKKKEELKENIKPFKIEEPKKSFKGLTWDKVSFEQVASFIKSNYEGYYFSPEMLLHYINNELGIQVYYFTSAEAKKNPQLLDADDFYTLIQSAITSNNPFLSLEQVFYDAEGENIKDITFTTQDLETLSKKTTKERSGIYFRIKDETTTH